MKFLSGSHKDGFFEGVRSSREGNVLSNNHDVIIPEKWEKDIYQSTLSPGECTFHDGKNNLFLPPLNELNHDITESESIYTKGSSNYYGPIIFIKFSQLK